MVEPGWLPPAGDAAEVAVGGRTLRLTSLDKVLYPAAGFTKRDLIAYYAAVADVLLPHLAGRPLTLGRWPSGVTARGFAQMECRGAPEWLRTRPLRLRSGELRHYCVIDERPALAWAANLGTLELHPYLGGGPDGEDALLAISTSIRDRARACSSSGCPTATTRRRASRRRSGCPSRGPRCRSCRSRSASSS